MKTLISRARIKNRISVMALLINEYYQSRDWYQKTQEPVIVIGVLTGAIFFMADLVRQLSIRIKLDFIRMSTYPGKSTTAQEPSIIALPILPLRDAHILLIDDILDGGKTINTVKEHLSWLHPESIRTAVLLRKPGKAPSDVVVDFVGFDIPDEWVAGYGMDDRNGLQREVKYIFVDVG